MTQTGHVSKTDGRASLPFLLRLLVLAVFFSSGMVALVYQITWMRMLYPVFGMHLPAISAVVATFMGGLGFGALLFGRLADRANPWRLYGWLEIGIGVWGLAIPSLTQLFYVVVPELSPLGTPTPLVHLVRIIGVVCLLAPPCLLMGGTFPAFTKGYVRSAPRLGKDLGLIYALNTIGGGVGCLLAGAALIPTLGMAEIVYCAAAANIVLGLIVLSQAGAVPHADVVAEPPATGAPSQAVARRAHLGPGTILSILLLTGFLSLSYEILWTRVLAQFLLGAFLSFSLILSSLLIGITLGSAVYRAVLADKGWPWLLPFLTVLLFAVTVGSFLAVEGFTGIMTTFEGWMSFLDDHVARLAARFLLCVIAFLPSATVFGAIFPLCLRLYAELTAGLGERLGHAYGINTIGTVAGVLFTGLVLIEWLGSGNTLLCLLTLNLVVIALAFGVSWRVGRLKRSLVVMTCLLGTCVVLFAWFPRDLFFANQIAVLSHYMSGPKKILFQAEDAISMATVVEEEQKPFTYVQNGEVRTGLHREIYHSNWRGVGGTTIYEWNVVSAHLAASLHPAPESILVIGYGSGRQLATLTGFQGPKRIDVVEINKLNFAASDYFYLDSKSVLNDPRVRRYVDDGRNHLLRSSQQYDLIIVDVGGLYADGTEFFYTREFLQLCHNHLRPGGLLFTWMGIDGLLSPLGWMYQNTMRGVFEDATIWFGGRDSASFAWLWVVGSREPFEIDYTALRRHWDSLGAAQHKELELARIESPIDLLSLFAAHVDDPVPHLIARSRILTDDHPFYPAAWENVYSMFDLVDANFLRDPIYYQASVQHLFQHAAPLPLRNAPQADRQSINQTREEFLLGLRKLIVDHIHAALRKNLGDGVISQEMLRAYVKDAPARIAAAGIPVDLAAIACQLVLSAEDGRK